MPLNIVAKAAITVALTAANMALTMSRKIEGPRLDDLKFTSGDYGAPLPLVWGLRRLDVPIFWAENLREVKRRRKTKGGKFNEYSYFGTWAVALAGHEIEGVSRIWFDTHLVYDLTGAGPVTPFDFGTGTLGDFITIYTGTETQEPDPRMQATVEAQFGEGSCPAYRGTAYIVFKDIPLEKIGNRIPQVSVEVVSNASPAYPYETFDTIASQPDRLWNFTFSTDYSRLMWVDGADKYEIWDVAARSRMIAGTLGEAINTSARLGMYADGSFLAVAANNEDLISFSADGLSSNKQEDAFPDVAFAQRWQQELRVLADENGREYYFTIPFSNIRYFYTDAMIGAEISDGLSDAATADLTMEKLTGVDWAPTDWFADDEGGIWAVGREPSLGATSAYFYRLHGGSTEFVTVSGLSSAGSAFGDCSACYHDGAFVLFWETGSGSHVYRIDGETGAILDSVAVSLDVYNTAKQVANLPAGSTSIWLNEIELSLSDLSTLRTVDMTDWVADDADGIIYDPINHALITFPQFDQEITWRYLDRIGSGAVTLETICNDVADMCGVEDYDFSDLTQEVQGWSATRGQASNMIGPLLDTFDSDIAPHDFTIRGLKRTGVTGGTLTTERFVANDPRYTVTVRQAAELPRATLVTFADVDADQQPNTVRSERPHDATGAVGEQAIDMGTLASDPDEMRGLGDRFHRRIWNSRQEVSLSLTAQQLALEPGDVRTLELDDETIVARLVRVTVSADDTLATEWRYDHPSLAVLGSTPGAPFDGRDPSVVIVPLLSKGFVLDIPLLEDSDNSVNPLLYMAAAPYADGTWPGAVLLEAVDGEYSEEAASVESSSPATWGYANETLPDANPWLWDRGSSVNVTIQTGTLSGATEAAIDANPRLNMALLGDEIINFTTATLEGDGTYTLSGFKRGRRGTEWACGTHADRDVFLLLNTAEPVEQGLSEVGTGLLFKAVTNGRTESGAFPIGVDYTGASLKPYAPVHLDAVKESNGDWTFSWVRRTRIGGAWTSGTSIPLGEDSEEYELDLSDGVTTVTKTGLTSPTYLWDVATQTSDTGAEVMEGDLEWTVAQISAAVDRGFEAVG